MLLKAFDMSINNSSGTFYSSMADVIDWCNKINVSIRLFIICLLLFFQMLMNVRVAPTTVTLTRLAATLRQVHSLVAVTTGIQEMADKSVLVCSVVRMRTKPCFQQQRGAELKTLARRPLYNYKEIKNIEKWEVASTDVNKTCSFFSKQTVSSTYIEWSKGGHQWR